MSADLRAAAEALLAVKAEPSYSWVDESQRERRGLLPNRAKQQADREQAAYAALRAALAAPSQPSRDALDVERLARAMHLARLLPDMEEPYCDNPLTDVDLAEHMRWSDAIAHAFALLPPYARLGEQP